MTYAEQDTLNAEARRKARVAAELAELESLAATAGEAVKQLRREIAETKRLTRKEMRCVFTTRAACPNPDCGSTRLKAYKVMPVESDGSLTRYTRCLNCGERFKHVEENPVEENS